MVRPDVIDEVLSLPGRRQQWKKLRM